MQPALENDERDAIFEKLRSVPENNKCFDCEKKNPKWASVYLGLFLCLDCAGKHREYGVQYSFVRSLTLDTWSKRQISFLEMGGNAKAAEYFKKNGMKPPYDYKTQISQKYKTDMTKKVDTLMNSMGPITEKKEEPTTTTEKVYKEEAPKEDPKDTKVEPNKDDDPFANNITIANANQAKAKGFSVEFSKSKPGFAPAKKGLAAKKIDNFDLDSLTLEEDSNKKPTNTFGMSDTTFSLSGNSDSGAQTQVKEVSSKTSYSSASNDANAEEKLKKFSNAKAISSDAFRDKSDMPSADVGRFQGQTAISSAQYFGYKEEDNNNGRNVYETVENVKDFMGQIGGKLKEKAGGIFDNLKTKWNERSNG